MPTTCPHCDEPLTDDWLAVHKPRYVHACPNCGRPLWLLRGGFDGAGTTVIALGLADSEDIIERVDSLQGEVERLLGNRPAPSAAPEPAGDDLALPGDWKGHIRTLRARFVAEREAKEKAEREREDAKGIAQLAAMELLKAEADIEAKDEALRAVREEIASHSGCCEVGMFMSSYLPQIAAALAASGEAT